MVSLCLVGFITNNYAKRVAISWFVLSNYFMHIFIDYYILLLDLF